MDVSHPLSEASSTQLRCSIKQSPLSDVEVKMYLLRVYSASDVSAVDADWLMSSLL